VFEDACPIPCFQKTYAYKLEYQHRNVFFSTSTENDYDAGNTTFGLFVCWETMLVEEVVEALVYDEINFITAVGGNLGLLLGFSCYSLLEQLIDFIRKRI
jgi:Amiloride-sensitive sodium channel